MIKRQTGEIIEYKQYSGNSAKTKGFVGGGRVRIQGSTFQTVALKSKIPLKQWDLIEFDLKDGFAQNPVKIGKRGH